MTINIGKNKSLFGLGLIALGVLLLLKYVGIISLDNDRLLGYFLFFYGVISAAKFFGSSQTGGLYISGISFICGVALLVVSYYEILSPQKLILPTILFSTGTGFILLFLNNTNEKIFLIIGSILLLSGTLSVQFFNSINSIKLSNRIGIVVLQYWPVLLVLIGLGIIFNRNRL